MREVIMLMRQWPQPDHETLNDLCETRLLMPGADLKDPFFRTFNQDVSILCSTFLDEIDEALLDNLPSLKLVAHFGRWHGSRAMLEARGIELVDTGDAGADEAADFALTQVLIARRRVGLPLIETGHKRTLDQGLGSSVQGIRLGLLGFDAVAGELAKRARALGMPVVAWTPGDQALPEGIERAASREDLAAQVDAVSVHADAWDADAPPVDDLFLNACGRETVLVNVTDAALVDEAALLHILKDYELGAAALDVVRDAALLEGCPNLIVTDRLATNTMLGRRAMAQRVIENVRGFLARAA